MENIRTVVIQMPLAIKAYTICKDGYYTIVLNDALSYEQRYISYMHELAHIQSNDFDKSCSVDMIEFFSHQRRNNNGMF